MPYYTINKYPVFITNKRSMILHNKCLEEGILPKGTSVCLIAGTDDVRKREAFIEDYLTKLSIKNPKEFLENWVAFDIVADEIKGDICYLLYDYCFFTGYSYLERITSEFQGIIENLNGDSDALPLGKVFSLNHYVKPFKWYWKYIRKMEGRKIEIIIDVDKIERISGTLNDFVIFFKNSSQIRCSKDNVVFIP